MVVAYFPLHPPFRANVVAFRLICPFLGRLLRRLLTNNIPSRSAFRKAADADHSLNDDNWRTPACLGGCGCGLNPRLGSDPQLAAVATPRSPDGTGDERPDVRFQAGCIRHWEVPCHLVQHLCGLGNLRGPGSTKRHIACNGLHAHAPVALLEELGPRRLQERTVQTAAPRPPRAAALARVESGRGAKTESNG